MSKGKKGLAHGVVKREKRAIVWLLEKKGLLWGPKVRGECQEGRSVEAWFSFGFKGKFAVTFKKGRRETEVRKSRWCHPHILYCFFGDCLVIHLGVQSCATIL